MHDFQVGIHQLASVTLRRHYLLLQALKEPVAMYIELTMMDHGWCCNGLMWGSMLT